MTKKTRHLFEKKTNLAGTIALHCVCKISIQIFSQTSILTSESANSSDSRLAKNEKKNSAIKILWLPLLSNRKRYSGNIL